jgi:hypothetical protein
VAVLNCRLVALGLLAVSAALGGTPVLPDRAFQRVPFAKWVAEGKASQIKWALEVPPAILSTHQRLLLGAQVRVDGRELERRRGEGDFLILLQVESSDGRVWQNHTAIDLNKIQPGMASQDLTVTERMFVLPGDYTLVAAVCDPKTLQHSLAIRKVHVAPLKAEPLPQAWVGLPELEFIPGLTEPPDVWTLPSIRGRMRLEVPATRPVHLQILVNTTPSGNAAGSLTAMRRNMGLAIPALKLLTGMRIPNGTLDAALLDLTHRKAVCEQKAIVEMDWSCINGFFAASQPGIVDVATLSGGWKMRQFFLDEVEGRLKPRPGVLQVVLVISGPAFFDNQAPAESGPLPPNPDRLLYYIRYRSTPVRAFPQGRGGGGFGRGYPGRARPGMRPIGPEAPRMPMPMDDLERSMEPLGARIFDAASPEDFRRILATILEQMGRY